MLFTVSLHSLEMNQPYVTFTLYTSFVKQAEGGVSHEAVESLLQKFAIQDFIRLQCRYHRLKTSTSEISGHSS